MVKFLWLVNAIASVFAAIGLFQLYAMPSSSASTDLGPRTLMLIGAVVVTYSLARAIESIHRDKP